MTYLAHAPMAGYAAPWFDSPDARETLARLNRDEWITYRRPAVFGDDVIEWGGITGAAEQDENRLKAAQEAYLYEVTGYLNLDDADENGATAFYISEYGRLPTISDAVDAEFAHREGRAPNLRVRPTQDELDAFKALVGMGLDNNVPAIGGAL
ncbi:hypothetical protein [Croceicoccus sp. YJ47]|uniref:hypothetical protein n=1 Tax=Croceicoccus sp. YJ47 TaxID=2798724 RepID=UPI001920B02D|nr:hypothetical protein [Croceicoccus sp. YJ47]QQN73925.1 hypothetical protein JD971_14440 [Croceicoccus sp. YJ47]